ncbi:MAG: hypothetical protein ACHQ53_05670 [Polyangiales bacterium]
MLLAASAANAQNKVAQTKDFNLDLVTGAVLGSGRIIGLSGAYTALATGIEGAPWNAAAYATRTLWATGWFDWDATASIVPTMLRNSDLENNGRTGFTYGDFSFTTVGLGMRFGDFGAGALINLHSYRLAKPSAEAPPVVPRSGADLRSASDMYGVIGVRPPAVSAANANLSLAIGNYGAGYQLADGQLMLGLGARTAVLSITTDAGDSLVDFGGTSPEVGAVLALADRPWRLGFAARLPVQSGKSSQVLAANLRLPRQIQLPWELQAGFAFQLGPRPLNRKWVNPHTLEQQLRAAMLARRRDREQRQLERERLAERMQLAQERALPEVAELEPPSAVPIVRDDVPKDPAFWAEEVTLRWNEERELMARLAELAQEREHALRALSRRYLLVSTEVIAIGATPDGVGLESFLSQQLHTSGSNVSIGLRAGVEGEPIADWVQMRAGSYLEPSRFSGGRYRAHATVGTNVRLFSWDLFGLLEEFTLSAGAFADVAERYLNAGLGVGLWH